MDVMKDLMIVLQEVLLAISPLIVVYLISQFWFLKYKRSQIVQLVKGTAIALIGLTLFLFGVRFGFIEVASAVGAKLSSLGSSNASKLTILIPIAFILGISTTLSDPAIYVLVGEVEETSGGTIPRKLILTALSVGVGGAISLMMVRLIFDFSFLYIIIPGYILAVAMSYFLKADFAAMSFDSGGVVTGTMIASFVLPFANGVSKGLGLGDAGFGIVGFVALVPILTMLTIGVMIEIKKRKQTIDIADKKE